MFGTLGRDKMGLRNSREALTLATAIDQILKGSPAGALDVLMQRLKALERSIIDGNWNTARWFELIPTSEANLSLQEEALQAQKLERSERDLKKS
eukprot:12399956-Karenia_brevis.AAC.1